MEADVLSRAPKSPEDWARLHAAMLADVARHQQKVAEEKDQLEQLRARVAKLEQLLDEHEHAAIHHALLPAQRIIAGMAEFKELFQRELRAALKLAAQAGECCDVESQLGALTLALTLPIFQAVKDAREIESANGQAGLCEHNVPRRPIPAVTAPRLKLVPR